jgi:hypothetical protein
MKKILTIAITTAAIVTTAAVAYAAINHNRKAKELRIPDATIDMNDHDIETVTKE